MDSNAIEHTNMKRLIFIPLLIFSLTLSAQFTKGGGVFLRAGSNAFITAPTEPIEPQEWDEDLETYITGLSTSLTTPTLEKLNTMVTGIKTALGITSLAQAGEVLYIFGNETSEAASRNLIKRSFDATLVNNPTFTQFEGYAGNGTSSYINSNFNVVNNLTVAGVSDISAFVYIRTDATNGNEIFGAGDSDNDGPGVFLLPKAAADIYFNINSSFLDNGNVTASSGFFTIVQNPSFTMFSRRNKTAITSLANVTPETYSGNIYILSGNVGGTAVKFDTRQVAIFGIFKSLTTTQIDALQDIFETYMDSNGKGVI